MTTLQALRIFGPCTASELSRRTDLDRYTATEEAEHLADQGIARRLDDGRWDVTDEGRAMIASQLRGLRREPRPTTRPWWFEPRRPA
jgi:DNA-binding IclR family transcriptional regulator